MLNYKSNNIVGPIGNNNNLAAPSYGPVGFPLSQPSYNDPYYPIVPSNNPTYNPPYSYRLPPYRLQPYLPPTYNYPIQTIPQIQTIPYPQYIPVPYLSSPYYYNDEDWDDPGHSCNMTVSHNCHHNGPRRGRRGRGLVFDPWNPGYSSLGIDPWDWYLKG